MNQINVQHKCWPNFVRYIIFIINTIVYINDLWTVLLNSNICCCLKIGKKTFFFLQIKNQMSLYGYLSIKQQHMYRWKRRFSMHHILWAIQTKERTKKRRRRSFVLSWESFVEFFGWWRIKPYNMTFHLHVWFSYKIA